MANLLPSPLDSRPSPSLSPYIGTISANHLDGTTVNISGKDIPKYPQAIYKEGRYLTRVNWTVLQSGSRVSLMLLAQSRKESANALQVVVSGTFSLITLGVTANLIPTIIVGISIYALTKYVEGYL